jgi:hypothetical protein
MKLNHDHQTSLPTRTVHNVARLMFSKPRAYTTATLGGLELVLETLRSNNQHEAYEELAQVLVPLVDAAGAQGVAGLPEALACAGRPPRAVSEALRRDELELALRGAFRALRWDDLVPCLSAWSTAGNSATDGVELNPADAVSRRTVLLRLAERVVDFERAWEQSGQRWSLGVPRLPGTTVKAAARTLGLPVMGVVAESTVAAQTARYGNRISRQLAVTQMPAWSRALSCAYVPQATLRQMLCVMGVVAEAVSCMADADKTASLRKIHIPVGAPVPADAWHPYTWWPVLNAWGAPTKVGQAEVATAWRLPAAQMDPLVWAISWVTAWVLSAASTPEGRLDPEDWKGHLMDTLTFGRQLDMAGVWDLYQSTRAVPARVPFPSGDFRLVDFANTATLPWALDEEVSA